MRLIHAIGYALAALLASTVGMALMATPRFSIWASTGTGLACALLGAYVGWNRLPRNSK
jgi:hypothetical protein